MATTGDYRHNKAIMKTFPKVELHRHLEGTFSLPTLHRIALANGLPYSTDFDEFKTAVQFPRDSEPDFLKFLSKFKNDWYRTHQDVYDITHDSVAALTDDGIFYIELRFSPEHFALHNDWDRLDITRVVIEAGNAAAHAEGIAIRYLITFNRAKQDQYQMLDLYHAIRDLEIPEIVGLDLAGDETQFPPEQFSEFFRVVAEEGVFRTTVHAGEVSPSSQIWASLDHLKASRIGHGTSSIDDEELQARLRREGIVLEQCITSNYQTGSWVDEVHHPLGTLYRKGVPVTLNSDDPTIQDTDLTDDYMKACRYFDLDLDDLIHLNEIALRGAFLSESDRTDLLARYYLAVRDFRSRYNLMSA